MNCLSQTLRVITRTLEWLGLYEPTIDIKEAFERLDAESKLWKQGSKTDRSNVWANFQSSRSLPSPLNPLVTKALATLEGEATSSSSSEQKVAVDLGCGISPTVYTLLEKGWKVYAVDSSRLVLDQLEKKLSTIHRKWITNGQLILVHSSIEKFDYPEKVHLITAVEALPYCNPSEIQNIFLRARDALAPQGIFVGNLFSYDNRPSDLILRDMFGSWLTTKNVVTAVVQSINFSSWSVEQGLSAGGLGKQFHIFAKQN